MANYFSRARDLEHLWDEIWVIREQLSGCSKGFAFILGMLYKSFDMIFGDWRTGGESFGEIWLVAIAEGSFAIGELTIKSVECIGTFRIRLFKSFFLGKHMYFLGGRIIDRVIPYIISGRNGEWHLWLILFICFNQSIPKYQLK